MLSIVISTYNKSKYLELTLFTLAFNKINAEIVIVDDGSSDSTRDVISKYQNYLDVNYVFQNNKGLASARNTGIKNSHGEYLLFMDDDRIVLNDYINHVVLKPDQILLGCRKELYISDFENKIDYLKEKIKSDVSYFYKKCYEERYYRKTKLIYKQEINLIPWVGCTFNNTLISKRLIEEVGGFDENFVGWGFEDLELAYRLWKYEKYPLKFVIDENLINYHIYHVHSEKILKERDENYRYFSNKHQNQDVLLYDIFSKSLIDIFEYNQVISKR